ncbi:hypothetical protein [Scopulibacillus darangshiensis]|uniref:hypothetical protein n=1 Tax=Scopulibacillus darangshiensis TaxID=442528 RepID=UPI00105019B5|nr:hypothetical protein [Scopulibacillus darangshiensis]
MNRRKNELETIPILPKASFLPNKERISPIIEPPIIKGMTTSSGNKSIPFRNKIQTIKLKQNKITDIILKDPFNASTSPFVE